MIDPYIGTIMLFGGNFAPIGWAFCDGSLQSIAANSALYSLIGTTYGGDGLNTFALPDLRGRIPIHQGQGPGLSNYVIGQAAGTENVTLISTQLPAHSHNVLVNSEPTNNFLAAQPELLGYTGIGNTNATMHVSMISSTSGGLPHQNMMPYLALNFVIALEGIYPTQN